MKLTFRTITGQTFNLDAEPTTLVGDLKADVEKTKGEAFPKAGMKLVYKGKVLEDEAKPISEYGVDETGFLVVFIAKKTEAKAPAAAASSAAPVRRRSLHACPCMATMLTASQLCCCCGTSCTPRYVQCRRT
jgi:UV excision repair protein RAD23